MSMLCAVCVRRSSVTQLSLLMWYTFFYSDDLSNAVNICKEHTVWCAFSSC